MAIKFKGNHTAGTIPSTGGIKERELVLNTADQIIYTSTDGNDVVKMSSPERGGLAYNSSRQYKIGDVVTIGDTIYVIGEDPSNPGNPMPIGGDPADPLDNTTADPISNTEHGGVTYDPSHQYKIGDVVTIGDTIYVIGEDPTNAGNPPPIGTLPGDPEWGTEPLEPERGGLAYNSSRQYKIGDVVTIGDTIYVIGEDPSNPGNPMPIGGDPADPLDNTTADPISNTEHGGVTYDPSHQYKIGDVVTIGDTIYVIGEDPTNAGNPPPIGTLPGDPEWGTEPLEPERGGIEFTTTATYVVNDTVIDDIDNKLYRCLTPGAVTQPSTTPADWEVIVDNSIMVTSEAGSTDGSDRISKIVSMKQADYDAIAPVPDTLYIIVG